MTLAQRLMKAPLGAVIGESVGKLKSVLVDRVETIELPLAHMIPECISNLLLLVAVFVYLVCIDWRMALAMLVTVPLAFIAFAMMTKNFNKLYADYMESNNYVNGVIVEYVEGIEVIKAFNQSSSSYEKFTKAVKSFKDYTLKWYQSTWKLMNFTTYVNGTKTVEYAVHDVDKLLHVEELPDTGKPVEVQSKDIQLQDVSFSYDKESGKQVLSHINLKIPEGKFTALVGPSGGGKSTIARLIARFYDVDSGKVTVGGEDVRNMTCDSLLRNISMVFQKVYLFHDTIENNIRFGNPSATQEEIIAAAKKARCHDFIMALPDGYKTVIGEGGSTLSGGEKQRISIARAILKNANIVILDEATASIDPENEHLIQQVISELTIGKTVIVIAHRLATIEHADQILVVDTGNHPCSPKETRYGALRRCGPAYGGVKAQRVPCGGNFAGRRFSYNGRETQ